MCIKNPASLLRHCLRRNLCDPSSATDRSCFWSTYTSLEYSSLFTLFPDVKQKPLAFTGEHYLKPFFPLNFDNVCELAMCSHFFKTTPKITKIRRTPRKHALLGQDAGSLSDAGAARKSLAMSRYQKRWKAMRWPARSKQTQWQTPSTHRAIWVGDNSIGRWSKSHLPTNSQRVKPWNPPNHIACAQEAAAEKKILRVIPTMTFIHFLTGKSSGILSDISSGILSGISSGISSGILSGKSSGILSGISSGILSDISSGILSGISSGILSDISSGILSYIPSGISSGILSGRWGPAVPTGIWSSRLRSGSAHWDLELAVEVRQCPLRPGSRGWGPAVPTAICNSRLRSGSAHWDLELAVEVRLCPLGSGLRGGGGRWGGGGGGGEELC